MPLSLVTTLESRRNAPRMAAEGGGHYKKEGDLADRLNMRVLQVVSQNSNIDSYFQRSKDDSWERHSDLP